MCTVSGAGEAVVQLGTLGEAVVGVAMARAHHCNSQARVRVEQPLKLSLGLHMQEVMLGNSLAIPVYLEGAGGPLSLCHLLP